MHAAAGLAVGYYRNFKLIPPSARAQMDSTLCQQLATRLRNAEQNRSVASESSGLLRQIVYFYEPPYLYLTGLLLAEQSI